MRDCLDQLTTTACNHGTVECEALHMPRVYNKRHSNVPTDAVYVGRPTVWGNPFTHLAHGKGIKVATREEAIRLYRDEVIGKNCLTMDEIRQHLRGKDLVCWCAPLPCHADILLEIANS